MNSLLPEHDVPPTAESPASAQNTAAAALILLISLFGLLLGCDPPAQQDPAPPTPPSPEVRFERLVSELRRRVEGAPGASNAISEQGASYTGGYQVVGGKLIEPETPAGVYRAKIEIRETASFTVITIPDEPPSVKKTEEAPGGELTEGIEDLLGPKSEAKAQRSGAIGPSPVSTQDHSETHKYDLAYVEGRWRLKTSIPKGTFLAGAFKLALNRQ